MTLDSLIAECELREEAARETGQLLDGAKTYRAFATKLRELDWSSPPADRAYTTAEAGKRLGVTSETVAGYCSKKQFKGAYRTSGATGPWRIPARDLATFIQSRGGQNGSEEKAEKEDLIDELDDCLEK